MPWEGRLMDGTFFTPISIIRSTAPTRIRWIGRLSVTAWNLESKQLTASTPLEKDSELEYLQAPALVKVR